MQLFRRAGSNPSRLGILPGTFNPVTLAHLALAHAALGTVDEVLFVLPREFPHKTYLGASFDQRIAMLEAALSREPAISIGASDGGLFAEIAAECRAAYPPDVRLTFLCGRDAAERIAGWDYGTPGAFAAMLRDFDLLVAARSGEYQPPPHYSTAISTLPLDSPLDHISATEVRDRLFRGEPWEHLVPAAIHQQVRDIYR